MRKSIRAFLINHSIITALLAILFIAIKVLVPGFPLPDSTWLIFGFFYLFVLTVHGYLLKMAEKRAQVFIRTFMVMTFAKLFIYLAFISVLLLLNRSDAKGIIIVFATLYVVNLVHELAALLKHLNQGRKSGEETP